MKTEKELLIEDLIDHSVLMQLEQDVGIATLARLMQLFVTELINLHELLSDAIKKSNIEEIQHVVHILKNSAAQFGAMPLAILAQNLHDTENIPPEQQIIDASIVLKSIEKSRLSYQELVNKLANQGGENEN
ncbi:MAG: Hpt domain-containing protein [Pseudoalteromonas sp.]